jgi:Tfp pilus assembly protein PilZ
MAASTLAAQRPFHAMTERPSSSVSRSDERRRDERIAARFALRFAARQQAARALRAYSINISASGLCIKTDRKYEVGMLMWLHMEVSEEVFDLEARVAWVRTGAIGVRFFNVPADVQKRLQHVVDEFRR